MQRRTSNCARCSLPNRKKSCVWSNDKKFIVIHLRILKFRKEF